MLIEIKVVLVAGVVDIFVAKSTPQDVEDKLRNQLVI